MDLPGGQGQVVVLMVWPAAMSDSVRQSPWFSKRVPGMYQAKS